MTVRVGEDLQDASARLAGQSHRADAAAQALWIALRDKRIRFLLTGAMNTAFGFACFASFQFLVGVRFGYMWTLLLTHVVSVLVAFASHRRLVFRVTGSVLHDLWRFESVYLLGLSINALLLPLAVEGLGLPVLVAQACITAINALVSWLGHSRFTFHRDGDTP